MALELNRTKGAKSHQRRSPQKADAARTSPEPNLNLPWRDHASTSNDNLATHQKEREIRLSRQLGLDFETSSRPKLPRHIDSASSLDWCLEIHKHLKSQAKWTILNVQKRLLLKFKS